MSRNKSRGVLGSTDQCPYCKHIIPSPHCSHNIRTWLQKITKAIRGRHAIDSLMIVERDLNSLNLSVQVMADFIRLNEQYRLNVLEKVNLINENKKDPTKWELSEERKAAHEKTDRDFEEAAKVLNSNKIAMEAINKAN